MRIRLTAAAGVLAVALALITGCGTETGGGETVNIDVKNMSFSPDTVTISTGDTVTWTFDDNGLPHNVVSNDETFESELLTTGSFSHTFDEAGTYDYHCTPHPMMVGTVIVQ